MFFPRKSKVFDELVKQSLILNESAQVLHNIAYDWKQLKKGYDKLQNLENQGDKFVKFITEDIEKVFILPLDKDDIIELTNLLDDIIDCIEEVVNRLSIYHISKSNQTLKDFSELIFQAAQQVHQGILMVKEHKFASKDFILYCDKLHHIENEGDKLHREILEKLLGNGLAKSENDFLSILKWKEIFQTLEDTLDKCEDIAITLGRLRIKYT